MDDTSFQRFGGLCAMLGAVASFAFALVLALPVLRGAEPAGLGAAVSQRLQAPAANLLLAAAGLLITAAVVALYWRLRAAGPAWAAWASGLGVLGGIMTAVHGLWDAIRLPALARFWGEDEMHRAAVRTLSYVPNPVDPRGIGSFLLVGIFVLVTARLMTKSGTMHPLLGQLGLAVGVLLVLVFVMGVTRRLGEAERLRVLLAGIYYGALGPLWWLLAGWELWRTEPE